MMIGVGKGCALLCLQVYEMQLRESVLLVFANKQDLPNAMSAAEMTDRLGLHQMRQRQWYIQACCATTGDGLYDGLDWLSAILSKKLIYLTPGGGKVPVENRHAGAARGPRQAPFIVHHHNHHRAFAPLRKGSGDGRGDGPVAAVFTYCTIFDFLHQ